MRKRLTRNKCSIKISSTNCYLIRMKANCASQFRLPLQNAQTGWLTQQKWISRGSGRYKSRIKMLPGEAFLAGLYMTAFSL